MTIKREELATTNFDDVTTGELIDPIHPGSILKEDFLDDLGITPYACAKAIGVPTPRINDVCKLKRAITPETALLLGKFLGTSAQFWTNLQASYDLEMAERAIHDQIENVQQFVAA